VVLKVNNDSWKYLLLVVFVMATRIPFIFSGYGIDGDAWSVAISAKYWHETGIYSASRLPGYPVHEFLCSLFINYGYSGLNLLSAVFSAFAVLFFALSLKALKFRYVFLAAVTFSMVPVFFIQSTTTLDYVFALAFIMAGMFYLLRGNIILAGVLVGFAIGCRVTSGAMLIPFSILLIENDGVKKNIFRILKHVVSAIVTGAVLFFPVFLEYGLDFFTYYNVPYPSIPKVLYKFSFEVWGVVGFVGLILATGLFFLPDRITAKKFLFPRSVNEKFVIAWLLAIDLYIIAFLKLPMESGYLIPIIPFVILIFGRYLYNRAFVFLCIMLILSSFVCTISPRERYDAVTPSKATFEFSAGGEKLYFDLFQGPVVSYEKRRENGILFVNDLLSSTDTINQKAVMVAGRWYNQMVVQCADTSKLKIDLRSYLSEEEALYYYAKGYQIYYLPKQDYYNKIMRNIDLEIYKAVPYIKTESY
jgi:hypothetical protein